MKRPVPLYDFKTFGATIKAARTELGESRKKVCDEMNISPRYLATLTNSQNAAKLRRHIYVAGRAKSDNENGYYIVDAINDAIDTKRKISFRYTDFDVSKQR